MSTLLKTVVLSIVIPVGIVAVAGASAYIISNQHLHRNYTFQPAPLTLPTSPDALIQGQHLAVTRGCTTCHGEDLGGAKVIDDPAMGKMYGPNITSGEGSVVRTYKTEDWIRTIQHGITPAGRPVVLMPSEDFTHLTADDLGDLIAYAKSVAPVNRESVPLRVGPIARVLMTMGKLKLAAEKIDHTAVQSETVEPGVTVAYGRYVAVSCIGCHNPSFSGGKIAAGPPNWPPAANLTPDYSSRLKRWTEADFIRALRTGLRPDGAQINPVMPRVLGQMNDTELKAIFKYLQSLPPKPTGQR